MAGWGGRIRTSVANLRHRPTILGAVRHWLARTIWLADDAVDREPVWGSKFPANREISREFFVFRRISRKIDHENIRYRSNL